MEKREMVFILFVIFLLIFSGYSYFKEHETKEYSRDPPYGKAAYLKGMEIHYAHRLNDDRFETWIDEEWKEVIIKGVNIGMGKPGCFPGEAAITKEEYRRWLNWIGEMNANAIRTYTIHPPGFYEALYDYNEENPEGPIYLFHGVWLTEEKVTEIMNAWDQLLVDEFYNGIKTTIDVINGEADLVREYGKAYGKYRADISRYVMGLIIGIEWEPGLVLSTNRANNNSQQFNGSFFRSGNASPFETWLASSMDFAAHYETVNYGQQRPVSFVNWPTTDMMEHPDEPAPYDDSAVVDPNHIFMTKNYVPGQFATYHIYPYYPDFMNLQPDYLNATGYEGQLSNYAGYLMDLKKRHDMPVVVGEFGLPTSRGIAHESAFGMDHGHLTEDQQGVYVSEMFRDIIFNDYAGGFIFSWQDEWFKRTWNTYPYNNASRRPYWCDVQTCEQHFGILGFEPGEEQKIVIDGDPDDWKGRGIDVIDDDDGTMHNNYIDGYNTGRKINSMKLYTDPGYLYIMLEYENLGKSLEWNNMNTLVYLDTIQDQGIYQLPFNTNVETENGIDFVIKIAGENDSRVMVDGHYDVHHYRYGYVENLTEFHEKKMDADYGNFTNIDMMLSRRLYIPTQERFMPTVTLETGKLRWGTTDPESEDYDRLADLMVSAESNCVEIRIPWNLINFKDPSRKEVMGDLWEGGFDSNQFIESIGIGVVTYKPDSDGNAVGGPQGINVAYSLLEDGAVYDYDYEEWDLPPYHERLKDSYYIVQETFDEF